MIIKRTCSEFSVCISASKFVCICIGFLTLLLPVILPLLPLGNSPQNFMTS